MTKIIINHNLPPIEIDSKKSSGEICGDIKKYLISNDKTIDGDSLNKLKSLYDKTHALIFNWENEKNSILSWEELMMELELRRTKDKLYNMVTTPKLIDVSLTSQYLHAYDRIYKELLAYEGGGSLLKKLDNPILLPNQAFMKCFVSLKIIINVVEHLATHPEDVGQFESDKLFQLANLKERYEKNYQFLIAHTKQPFIKKHQIIPWEEFAEGISDELLLNYPTSLSQVASAEQRSGAIALSSQVSPERNVHYEDRFPGEYNIEDDTTNTVKKQNNKPVESQESIAIEFKEEKKLEKDITTAHQEFLDVCNNLRKDIAQTVDNAKLLKKNARETNIISHLENLKQSADQLKSLAPNMTKYVDNLIKDRYLEAKENIPALRKNYALHRKIEKHFIKDTKTSPISINLAEIKSRMRDFKQTHLHLYKPKKKQKTKKNDSHTNQTNLTPNKKL